MEGLLPTRDPASPRLTARDSHPARRPVAGKGSLTDRGRGHDQQSAGRGGSSLHRSASRLPGPRCRGASGRRRRGPDPALVEAWRTVPIRRRRAAARSRVPPHAPPFTPSSAIGALYGVTLSLRRGVPLVAASPPIPAKAGFRLGAHPHRHERAGRDANEGSRRRTPRARYRRPPPRILVEVPGGGLPLQQCRTLSRGLQASTRSARKCGESRGREETGTPF